MIQAIDDHTDRRRTPGYRSRRALVVACVANATEWYDFAVYGAMASVLVVVLLAPGPEAGGLVVVFAVFASSFLARPLGALLIGLHADRSGRRDALAAMVLLMTGATAAIGLLPPWSTVGGLAPLSLLLLRVVQGFSSGGQISTSIPFLLESAPRLRWGFYAGWHTATVALGIAAGIGVAGLTTAALGSDDLESWGWRLPFLLALPLGLVGLYLRSRLDETPAYLATASRASRPRLSSLWREHAPAVRTGFVLAGVLAGTFNLWFVFLPTHLAAVGAHDLPTALACAALGLVATAVASPVLGSWSDRIGRRPMLATSTASLCVLALPLYAAATAGPVALLILADVLVGVSLGGLVVTVHLAERFPVGSRATGIALTYGLATAILGGTAPLVGSLLAQAGRPRAVPIYLVILAAAGLVAALRARPGRVSELPATGDAAGAGLRDGGGHGPHGRRSRHDDGQ